MEAEAPKGERRGRRYAAESRAAKQKTGISGFEEEAVPSAVCPLIEINKKHLILEAPELAGKDVEIFIEDKYLFSATVSRHGEIKLRLNSDLASRIIEAQDRGELIEIRPI
jgi:ATPase